MDLMKPQVIQATTTTRSAALPPAPSAVTVGVGLVDAAGLELRVTLEGLFGGTWLPILAWRYPDPPPAPHHDATASRVRLVLDPSRPASVGATLETDP